MEEGILPWWGWIMGGLILLLGIVFEYTFRKVISLRADLKKLAVALKSIHIAPSVRRAGWIAYENRAVIQEALDLPGVRAVLEDKKKDA